MLNKINKLLTHSFANKILPKNISNAAIAKLVANNPLNKEIKNSIKYANTLREEQKYVAALAELEALAQENPNVADIYNAQARVYMDLGMQRKAHQMLAQSILCDPNNHKAALTLSRNILKKAKTPIRDSIADIMLFAKQLQFKPNTIIDVGVNTGTPGLFEFFPNAKLLMIDPISENEPFMEYIASLYGDAHYDVCAASTNKGELTMSVFPSYGGSAVIEVVGRQMKSVDRKVPACRIDDLVEKYGATGPFVIKVDTEGGEMDVLGGATKTLEQTEMLILETRVRPYLNAPVLLDVTDKLRSWGFLPYDFIDRNYNDADGTLKQFDVVAVRENGYFRTSEQYTPFASMTSELLDTIVSGKLHKRDGQLKTIQNVLKKNTNNIIFESNGESLFPIIDYDNHPYYKDFASEITDKDRSNALEMFEKSFNGTKKTYAGHDDYIKNNPLPPVPEPLKELLHTLNNNGIVGFRFSDDLRNKMRDITQLGADELLAKRASTPPEELGVEGASLMLGRFDNKTDIYEFFDSILREQGIYELCQQHKGLPYFLKFVNLQINEDSDTSVLRNCSYEDGNHAQTFYMHIDSSVNCMKVIVYRSETTENCGAFRYLNGSHKMASREEQTIRKANDKGGLDVIETRENRKLFAALPKKYQQKANFGNDLIIPSEQSARLLAAEEIYGIEKGDMVLFNNDGIHRGVIFNEPHQRQIFQLLLSPGPFIKKGKS